ncbi:MAG TPA: flagellar hook-associated protein FlgK [Solirubrobacterales bacterium]|nr:flagellar hook-associated protein FlgK [Solirubrobacterales bacterium]
MAVSTFTGLQTALRGLLAQQRALDVTSHNVANANTVGYSRQEAVLAASPALRIPAGAVQGGGAAELGTGVDVAAYRRIRDQFLDLQYRAQAMRLGGLAAQVRGLEGVEVALAEPGENGIAAQLGKFWSGWEALANAPENQATRQALLESGVGLAGSIAALDRQLATASEQAAAEYESIVAGGGEVGQMAAEIARLNESIRSSLGSGSTPNDLLDRRDLLLDRLSALAQVSVTDLGDGTIEVEFGDAATPLVAGTAVSWPQALAEPGGKLGALLEISGPTGTIASYRADLDAFAGELAETVNAIHASGGGPAFFSFTPGSAASTLAVAVGAAEVQTSVGPAAGANDIAIAIGALRGGSADQAYASFVSRVGTDMSNARRAEQNADALTAAIDARREATAGVSLDEEMTNLIRFQRAYQASARAMTSFDEALDVLVNRTGRVGL